VTHAALPINTALAELFQLGRTIEAESPHGLCLTSWVPMRPLRLLDIRRDRPVRAGASHVLNTGPLPVCRRWAPAIAIQPQKVDGLLYASSMTGSAAVALFLPSADSFPRSPELSLPPSDLGLFGAGVGAAERIGYATTWRNASSLGSARWPDGMSRCGQSAWRGR